MTVHDESAPQGAFFIHKFAMRRRKTAIGLR